MSFGRRNPGNFSRSPLKDLAQESEHGRLDLQGNDGRNTGDV
jgi:hypothetical protein